MKVVYVAGPYSGPAAYDVEQNIRAAEEAALDVWQAGGVAICPHKNHGRLNGARGLPDSTWVDGGIELLSRSDALLLYSTEWGMSRGTAVEVMWALDHQIPVFATYHVDPLRWGLFLDWIKGGRK